MARAQAKKQASKKRSSGRGPGRPRKIASPEIFDALVDEYIEHCRETSEPITWTGLALHLGFCCRADIDEYLNYDGFPYSVKRGKLLVENAYEKRMHGQNPTGAIFVLKNMGWFDRQELAGPNGGALFGGFAEAMAKLWSNAQKGGMK